MDDALVWDFGEFEGHIWHVLEFLELTGNNGITQNPTKFVFGKKELEFIGFHLSEDGFAPAPAIVQSIREFPRPQNISGCGPVLGWWNKYPLPHQDQRYGSFQGPTLFQGGVLLE